MINVSIWSHGWINQLIDSSTQNKNPLRVVCVCRCLRNARRSRASERPTHEAEEGSFSRNACSKLWAPPNAQITARATRRRLCLLLLLALLDHSTPPLGRPNPNVQCRARTRLAPAVPPTQSSRVGLPRARVGGCLPRPDRVLIDRPFQRGGTCSVLLFCC